MNWSSRPSSCRRSFTLVEVILAGVIIAFVLGSVSSTISQLAKAKSTSRMRFDAHHRADVALTALRRDIVSIIRADDLFYTRLLLLDDHARTGDREIPEVDRDEILVFNTRLREMHPSDYAGEGIEYETQYRVEDDEFGPILWQRRDAVPEEYPRGGGIATPLVEGVIGLSIEVYDGDEWHETWDSDEDGLPLAVQIMVTTSGHRQGDDPYDAPIVDLRTVVPIDRLIPPKDLFKPDEEAALAEQQAAEQDEVLDELENIAPNVFEGDFQGMPPNGGEMEFEGPNGERVIRREGGSRGPGGRPGGRPGGGGGGGGDASGIESGGGQGSSSRGGT